MASFGKYPELGTAGWDAASSTQEVGLGQHVHVGLFGVGPGGEALVVRSAHPKICVVHEEPPPASAPGWRHFLLTGLQDGVTRVFAALPGRPHLQAMMTAKVTGKSRKRMVYFPGERVAGGVTLGAIYGVGGGERIVAAGGEPVGRPDGGGHTVDPTPPGNYVLGPRERIVTSSWPKSVIPFGAELRLNKGGEVEFKAESGRFHVATGKGGLVVQAQMEFFRRGRVSASEAEVIAMVRAFFLDGAGNLREATWKKNDFGKWGWNLRKNGHSTAYFLHTTPKNERTTEENEDRARRHLDLLKVNLDNSHGCVHLVPKERDKMEQAGYLQEGVPFEVRPYTETGPPIEPWYDKP